MMWSAAAPWRISSANLASARRTPPAWTSVPSTVSIRGKTNPTTRRLKCFTFTPTSASTAGPACRRAPLKPSSRSTKRRIGGVRLSTGTGTTIRLVASGWSLAIPATSHRGDLNGADRPSIRRQLHHDQHRPHPQLGARVVYLADGVRSGLLCDRDDGGVGLAVRHLPLWRRGLPRFPAAVRSDDCCRHRHQEDGPRAAPPLRSDAGAQVGHLDGKLLERRRSLSDLQRAPGRR